METVKNAVNAVSNALGGSTDTPTQNHDQDHSNPTTESSTSTQQTTTDTTTSTTPSTDSPSTTQGSRTLEGGAHEGHTASHEKAGGAHLPDELEKTLSGPKDPALQGEEHPKMTGEGAPGSHSALFGLTPDGKRA
jgi:hypothetical protein